MRIDINICTKDRHSELALLLQSLRTQTIQDFDIQIVDGSQTPILTRDFVVYIINQLKLEGHKVTIEQEKLKGVCQARNQCFELGNNPLTVRIDDDSICKRNFLEKLIYSYFNKADLVNEAVIGCIVPMMGVSLFKRNSNLFNKLSEIKINKDGNIEKIGDDLFTYYTSDKNLIEVDHVRSSFLFSRELGEKMIKKYGFLYDTGYGFVGFREESDFSLRAKMLGAKLYADVSAVCWHLQAQSGGVRTPEYVNAVQKGDERFKRQIKKWSKKGVRF
jgi:hypothetical protein